LSEGAVRLREEEGVSWITLDRPEKLNAFAGRMREDLHATLESIGESGARVVVIEGAGRAFSAGADLEVMEGMLEANDADGFRALVEAGARVVRTLRAIPQPVVAAVGGVAAGAGASLAAACDLRIAAARARIGFTFNRIGLHPDWGSSHFLPRLVGVGRARELVYSGRMVEAEEAQRIGLFDRVVADAEFAGAVRTMATELASGPPLAISAAKSSLDGRSAAELDAALVVETEAQMRCFGSRDVREGVAAFREKRAARYQGT
jgi:2-(1,2-epoxy-1,2-dihydrophenyl)acetyl-CoA isomerase